MLLGFDAAKPGADRQLKASATSLNHRSAFSLLSRFLSGCHLNACAILVMGGQLRANKIKSEPSSCKLSLYPRRCILDRRLVQLLCLVLRSNPLKPIMEHRRVYHAFLRLDQVVKRQREHQHVSTSACALSSSA